MDGVGGMADNGVGGCGMVADDGVRLMLLCCGSFRLLDRGSGVLAKTNTSSSKDRGVGKRTTENILGAFTTGSPLDFWL